jgi:ribosomal protein L37E
MYDKCHSCGSTDLNTDRQVEDCRRNGDAYGTETITCNLCGWSTSNKFDDAAETYYYETAYAARIVEPIKPQIEPLTPELEASFAKMAKIRIPRDGIRQGMVLRRIREEDIDAFMLKYNVE